MSSYSQPMPRHRNGSTSSAGRSSHATGKVVETKDFSSPTAMMKYFEPCAATASMMLYGQGTSVVVAHHDSLTIERRFSRHAAEVQLLAVDTTSDAGAGRLVVSYDLDMTAIVWDLMTGDEVARFASYENLTCAAWMKNGNVAFGNSQGNVILFEPTTSEHLSARTIDQITVTAIAPAADCRTFAIGYQNGSLLIATLQPRFTILHNLSTSRAPSPIVNLSWHASSARQKADMLAVQTEDGDLRVWSVTKTYNSNEPAKIVRILKRTDNFQRGPNWMGWSKNGRIIQYSEGETLSWDVRTKHVTYDSIPTLEHIRGLAVYGPAAALFTLGAQNSVQQFDLNTPSQLVNSVQHPANLLPPSPPVSIEEQSEQSEQEVVVIASDSDAMSIPINSEVSESDEEHMSPIARIARGHDLTTEALEHERYMTASPVSSRSKFSDISRSTEDSGTHGRRAPSTLSRTMTDNTYISAGSSMRSSAQPPYGDKDAYSISSVSSASFTSSRTGSHRPSRLRNEVPRSPDDNKVHDLFKYTRSRLHDIPYKRAPIIDQARMTTDDLRRQMLTTIFGWNKEIDDLVRDELMRHPAGSSSRILLAKWLGDIDADIMTASSENMTSSDWMLLALSGIGGQASQHKLGRAYVQRLLESGDIHAAATIMIGMGDHNDAIEIYVSHKRYMEALILLCLFFPNVWERQQQILKKWGEFAVAHSQQQLAIRCLACCDSESSEPWASPSAAQVTFQSLNQSIPEILSPPLSPPGTLGPQRSIAKTSALKLITTFGDQAGKSKFFSGVDDGRTPIAAGATPIAESAVDGHDPMTAFIQPSQRSALNTPASAVPVNGLIGARSRLPSIGEVKGEVPTPDREAAEASERLRMGHARKSSGDEQYTAGLSLARAATASPMMMRDLPKRKDLPMPSPSPDKFAVLMNQSGRSSRNGARERVPDGIDLKLQSIDARMGPEVGSPESSVPSARFHWPSRRRGPGSVASSVTSNSSAGRSYKSSRAGTRTLDDYLHALESANDKSRKQRTRESSRHRAREERDPYEDSRESSRNRSDVYSNAADRGRGISRNWTPKPAKHSPTSPIPMSPEDLINLSTPKYGENNMGPGSVASMSLDPEEPSTVRKSSQIRRTSPMSMGLSSRASSREDRRRNKDKRPPALDIRGRSKGRGEGSLTRSPSSPLPMSAIPGIQGSDDERELKEALQAQEAFRNRHNKSRGFRDPTSPAVHRTHDFSETKKPRHRAPSEAGSQLSAHNLSLLNGDKPESDLVRMLDERQAKKDAAARELEERRKSLARRPSAPPGPSPEMDSFSRPYELPSSTFVASQDVPRRSQTADFTKTRSSGKKSVIGLPATPKAMRLQFDSDMGLPSVPSIPQAFQSQVQPASAQRSPEQPARRSGGEQTAEEPPSLLTLLPSTVYSPPGRPDIQRSMSAPPEKFRPSSRHSRKGSMSRKMSTSGAQADLVGMDGLVGGVGRHSRGPSRDDIPPPPPPPPAPPILKELQHLAFPPPPPPAPLPGVRPTVIPTGGNGSIEIVMDEEENNTPYVAPVSESTVPIIAPPAPRSHSRGRSISEKSNASFTGRFQRATDRMRSASRGPSRPALDASKPAGEQGASPYESILPTTTYHAPLVPIKVAPALSNSGNAERHPRDVRAAFQQQQQEQQIGTGMARSEMI